MTARGQLRVRVNDELVLDAGSREAVSGPQAPERLIRPPETPRFHQVLAHVGVAGIEPGQRAARP